MAQRLVRAERIALPSGLMTWTVVGSDNLPIDEVDEWLDSLRGDNCSTNTIEAYARHVSLFLRWLELRSASWEHVDKRAVKLFIADLIAGSIPLDISASSRRKPSVRKPTSAKAVMAAVTSFIAYWQFEGRGPTELKLVGPRTRSSGRNDHMLSHIEHKRERVQSEFNIRGGSTRPPIKTINFEEDFNRLLEAANTTRDKLLLSVMYDGGLRIGQAVGLRHSDLDPATRRITVVRRLDNANGALSKRRGTFTIDVVRRPFTLHAKYLIEEQLAAGIESDYVFTNLAHPVGSPLTPSNARTIIERVGERAGVPLTPHTLRHTHATHLAKIGWTAPQIAARLGQSSNSSADAYIHLAAEDIEEKFEATLGLPDREGLEG